MESFLVGGASEGVLQGDLKGLEESLGRVLWEEQEGVWGSACPSGGPLGKSERILGGGTLEGVWRRDQGGPWVSGIWGGVSWVK